MDSKKIAEIFYRFLSKKKHVVDGFKIEFNYVKSEESYFIFGVNVDLPTKEWSYFKRNMEERVSGIIQEVVYPIYGGSIAMRLDMTINSEPARNVYINKQKLKEIYKQINSKFDLIKINNYTFNLGFNFTPQKYRSNLDDILIPFFVDVNIKYMNKSVTFREVYLEDVSAFLWEYLNSDPNLSMDVSDECFRILQNELRLSEDSLIISDLKLNTVNGFTVKTISDYVPSEKDLMTIFTLKND